jgi:hypothetical protein
MKVYRQVFGRTKKPRFFALPGELVKTVVIDFLPRILNAPTRKLRRIPLDTFPPKEIE